MAAESFPGLLELAKHLREELQTKKFVLLYAYNGTGKTRLSVAFKDLGKNRDERDTLYFNAFTEDLFFWDNDLKNDRERVLKINKNSRFFDGLGELEMDNRIRPLLNRYADFEFEIDTDEWEISFAREIRKQKDDGTYETKREEDIKVSRGEENIFIWCFFLAIVLLALDGAEAYKWVKYIYIDDPISSLDENNAIAVANHLAQMLTQSDKGPRVVVSTHHVLFFNVLCNELKKKAHRHFLKNGVTPGSYSLLDTTAKPFLHHLATLVELHEVQESGALYTHHFNMMRRVMEQTANFFGLEDWQACIKTADDDDPYKTLYKRMIDLMSHGDYSLYEPREMMEENKVHFRTIFSQFIAGHPFNPALFQTEVK
ncbi:AAA family ATPase [Ralstonia pseudosolanacearum]|uniref:AAA family ATPase n=1 Tax=Ralstonia pseudosolanacearum TaxID=1310165 RepID=UPI001FFA2456|nr:AAA family ATPase [Ralstonia pseudosolanacearum]MDO3620595.1 AAA family ATPase [Ralstonia pseudosolanacearum]